MKLPKYTPQIKEAYDDYLNRVPLNINHEDYLKSSWENVQRLSYLDFVLLTLKARIASTLDDFVSISSGDFDNLAPILKSLINKKILTISSQGTIEYLLPIEECLFPTSTVHHWDNPNNSYNQFPCTKESLQRRYFFLQERYALWEKVSIGLLGDDDLLSIPLSSSSKFNVSVYEYDDHLIKYISLHSKNIFIEKRDLSIIDQPFEQELDTFLIDPPYTIHGVLSFIVSGLKSLKLGEESEFYVIMNSMMLGKSYYQLLEHLTRAGVFLFQIEENFNQYNLPKEYKERSNADTFLQEINVEPGGLTKSSSSHLYIFRTKTPDVKYLSSLIKERLIYNHYQW